MILKVGFILTTTFSFTAAVSAVPYTGHGFPVSFSSYISILFLVCAKRAKILVLTVSLCFKMPEIDTMLLI